MGFRDFLTLGLKNNPDGLDDFITFGLEAGPAINTGNIVFKRSADIFVSKAANGGQNTANTVKLTVRDFSYNINSRTELVSRSTLDGTDPRGTVPHISAITPVNFSMTTYIGPLVDTNVTSPEEFLWVSLMGVDTLNSSPTSSTIDFANGDVTELQDLTLWFNYPNNLEASYRLDNAIIDSAEVNFGINQIAEVVWRGRALSMTRDNSTPTSTDRSGDVPCLKNKLSTISVNMNSIAYQLALTGGSLRINNNNTFYGRVQLGETTVPTGHYTGKRVVDGRLNFYLKTGESTSADLFDELLTNISSTDYETDFSANILVNVGGPNAPNIQFRIPKTLLGVGQQGYQEALTMDVPFTAIEAQNNYLNVIYQV